MKFVLFYHSLVSDWNHGNAHFLRGIVRELQQAGCDVEVYEPSGSWSRLNLLRSEGATAIQQFRAAFPSLRSIEYNLSSLQLDRVLQDADVVIAHEWNDPALIAGLSAHRRHGGKYCLLFHDTHHRAVSAPHELARFDLSGFDAVLAFGATLREVYARKGWRDRAFTWHEAADVELFRPRPAAVREGVVWIGNWGDGERATELEEYLFGPAQNLRVPSRLYGVRYPREVQRKLQASPCTYRGWVPNFRVPTIFSEHQVTVHIPRRFYRESLPGIPTIRVFEALACGIPLVCSPWDDCEGLFSPGSDYLIAQNGREMLEALREVVDNQVLTRKLAQSGRQTILNRHTCRHRVDELFTICRHLGVARLPIVPQRPQRQAGISSLLSS